MSPVTMDLQQFLTDYFGDEELTTLCYEFFPEVHNTFASGMSKGQKVQLLIEYVQHREELPDLLTVLQQQRPAQYAQRFGQAEATPVMQPRPASPALDTPAPRVQPHADSARALRVFLCHASSDKPAVRDLYQRLHDNGIDAWLDEEDLLPGQDWQRAIPKAVRDSDVVLVCLSRSSINKAGFVQKEIKFALDVADEQPEDTIFLIPLKLEECDVPERLGRWHWVNLFSPNGYERLMRALRIRAEGLKIGSPAIPASASPKPEASSPAPLTGSGSNTSGGIDISGSGPVSVGKDMVGRDKIVQADTYIEHATIIQSGSSIQEIGPTVGAQSLLEKTSRSFDQPMLSGEVWLNDPNNRRVIGGLDFVRVPAGKFLMGSTDDPRFGFDAEKPQCVVEIPYDYWMARYPVTNELFAAFLEAEPDQAQLIKKWANRLIGDVVLDVGPDKAKLKNTQEADHPVHSVWWKEAMAYCTWLNEKLQSDLGELTLRLPTEAEWEKAARGEYGNEWPWGNEFDKNKCNSDEGGKKGTTRVGAYSPQGNSPYGVADMAGNVYEWSHSLYKKYPYKPGDLKRHEDESDSGERVMRGGSFLCDSKFVRCAYRGPDYVFQLVSGSRRPTALGFRIVVAPALS
jgi:formylglycine-generating enzyme required for sulfatase activity